MPQSTSNLQSKRAVNTNLTIHFSPVQLFNRYKEDCVICWRSRCHQILQISMKTMRRYKSYSSTRSVRLIVLQTRINIFRCRHGDVGFAMLHSAKLNHPFTKHTNYKLDTLFAIMTKSISSIQFNQVFDCAK